MSRRPTLGKQGKSGEPQASLLTPAPVFVYSDPDADNQEKSSTQGRGDRRSGGQAVKNGRLTMIGLPEIVPVVMWKL